MAPLKAYILCRFAEQSGIYSWMDQCPIPCQVIDEYLPDWPVPGDAGIVITHMHYRWEEATLLRKLYERNQVPILILADGILEYRNTWEHPELASGAMFQPVMGHKLACLGRGQARVVESWGNIGKCEIVGQPRFDQVVRSERQSDPSAPFSILIATANTPAFNEEQREAVVESLTHIRNRLENNPKVSGRETRVTWRLTDNLDAQIGVVQQQGDDLPTLSEEIDRVDAVITTPSTVYLESALKGKPTALLDFHNSPHYVSAAWTINAPKHFNWILRELAAPPPAKMLFQDFVLNDQLECRTPATPRMLHLIQAMVDARKRSIQSGQPIELPHRVLTDPQHGFAAVPASFDPATLYPEPLFQEMDVRRLQVELNQAIKRLDTLPLDLQEKSRLLGDAIEIINNQKLRISRMFNKISDMHARIISLRERLGIIKPEDAAAKEKLKPKK